MNRRALTLGALAGLTLAPFAACSGEAIDNSDPSDVDAAVVEGSMTRDTGPSRDGGAEYSVDGWLRLDFDPDCAIYAAPAPEKMPPPIAWEPCDPIVTEYDCRQVKFDWSAPKGEFAGLPMMGASAGWTDSTGKPWLSMKRFTGQGALEVVAEPDGRVHVAVLQANRTCVLGSSVSLNGRVLFETSRRDASGVNIFRSGAIGGAFDEVPRVIESVDDGRARNYRTGPNAYFALGDSAIRAWAPAGPSTVLSVTDPGSITKPQFQGDALFFSLSNLMYSRVKLWTPTDGLRDFVSFGNDVSHHATDFGTDGIDMVWIEAEGRATAAEPFKTIDILTTKFTAELSAVQKRRVRSGLGSIGVSPFTVGCGYAARELSMETGRGVHLVRLADGRSWRILEIPGKPYWTWLQPLALTCDEVFLDVSTGGVSRLARVRIDSLGPGESAD